MPKDAKGHGSNSRGGAGKGDFWEKAVKRVQSPEGAAETLRRYGGTQSNWRSPSSASQDHAAAETLASGPKSAPAPVHEAMQYAPDHPGSNAHQHEYNPESVNRAIANSGKFGGGKIGKREGRMIHAILKGRGR